MGFACEVLICENFAKLCKFAAYNFDYELHTTYQFRFICMCLVVVIFRFGVNGEDTPKSCQQITGCGSMHPKLVTGFNYAQQNVHTREGS